MNRKEMEGLFKQFDGESEIIVMDSVGSEFPVDRIDRHGNKIAIILKRSYKNADNGELPLRLESDRHEKK